MIIKKEPSYFQKKLHELVEHIMDERYIRISRSCAIIHESWYKRWGVFIFAMLACAIVLYEVMILCILLFIIYTYILVTFALWVIFMHI